MAILTNRGLSPFQHKPLKEAAVILYRENILDHVANTSSLQLRKLHQRQTFKVTCEGSQIVHISPETFICGLTLECILEDKVSWTL